MSEVVTSAYTKRFQDNADTRTDARAADAMTGEYDLISPNEDGSYDIWEVECFSDCIAVAPIPAPQMTRGGIALPTAPTKDIGIVVGVPPQIEGNPHRPAVGQMVLFSSRMPVGDLTGKIPEYGDARVYVVRMGNVFAALPQAPVNIH